jgi:hypothetical protein
MSTNDSHGHDQLTSIPPELLIKLFSEVPLSSFLDLVHTSQSLHAFVKGNAARICNMAIRSRFAFEAKFLEVLGRHRIRTQKTNAAGSQGWLLPGRGKLEQIDSINSDDSASLSEKWQVCGCCECWSVGTPHHNAPRTSSDGCGDASHEVRHVYNISHYSLLGSNWGNKNVGASASNNLMSFKVPGPHLLQFLENVALEFF